MPKRRVPGHLHRAKRARRRIDGPQTETPDAQQPAGESDGAPESAPAPIFQPADRALRPTQRAGAPRFVRGTPAPEPQVDYRYVVKDLRQIGILATGAFVILIGLSFVIR